MGSTRHCAEAHPVSFRTVSRRAHASAWEETRRLRLIVISRHEYRHDLVRFGHEPHCLAPPLEHQRRRLALVGPHAVGALHALPEPPRTLRPAPGGIVAPPHQGP